MQISIFGLGYVGCVSVGCLAQNGHTVIGVDVNKTKVGQINAGMATIIEKDIDSIIKTQRDEGRISATSDFKKAILDTEISIIAVGTPSTEMGHLNLEYIYDVAKQFGEVLKQKDSFHIIAIRSTVEPATCEKFENIVAEVSGKTIDKDFAVLSNPEFLREGTAVNDYYNPPLTLVGSKTSEPANKLAKLYEDLPAEIIITNVRTAEIMKYVNNTFHALKIGFANEVGNICHALGIDSHEVMDIFVKDKQLNISPYYFKPGFAYGGSCLPKDLKGLQTLAHDKYLKVPIIESIDKSNDFQIERVIQKIIQTGKRKLGFLGLSFKAGTDDLRNSPTVAVVETLLGKGYNIQIFDKNVHLSNITGTNREFIEKHIPHLAGLLTDKLDEVVDENEILIVTTKEKEFIKALTNVNGKIIYDLVRLGNDFLIEENYYGINW